MLIKTKKSNKNNYKQTYDYNDPAVNKKMKAMATKPLCSDNFLKQFVSLLGHSKSVELRTRAACITKSRTGKMNIEIFKKFKAATFSRKAAFSEIRDQPEP